MQPDHRFIETLLRVEYPWELRDIRVSPGSRRCDIWIDLKGQQRNWWGMRRPGAQNPEKTWRHLNVMNLQTWVHVSPPPGTTPGDAQWAGDERMPFTHAMAQQMFALFDEGLSLEAICRLFDVDVKDLWRYKFAIDHGRADRHGKPPDAGTAQASEGSPDHEAGSPAAQPGAPVPGSSGAEIPALQDPVWTNLASGRFKLDVRMIGLQSLMARTRAQFQAVTDDVRALKIRELHRFFVTNSNQLGHEIEQLRRLTPRR